MTLYYDATTACVYDMSTLQSCLLQAINLPLNSWGRVWELGHPFTEKICILTHPKQSIVKNNFLQAVYIFCCGSSMYYFGYYVALFNMDRARECSRFCTASGLGFAGTLLSAMAMVSVLGAWGEAKLHIGKWEHKGEGVAIICILFCV